MSENEEKIREMNGTEILLYFGVMDEITRIE